MELWMSYLSIWHYLNVFSTYIKGYHIFAFFGVVKSLKKWYFTKITSSRLPKAEWCHESMIYQFDLDINLNSLRLDREEDRDLPQPHSIFFFPLAAKTNWTLRPFPFSSFFPATAAFRFKGTRQPSTPAHQYNGALHFFKDLSPIFDWPCHLLHYVLKTWLIWLWLMSLSDEYHQDRLT